MRAVSSVIGRAVPIDRPDIDTDQIVPAVWMKKIERVGFADGLFQKWRRDPAFVLNQPERRGATILIAGANFGCGSSREHAVWALRDYGFGAIIAPSFADIHRNNLPSSGLVPVVAAAAVVDTLMAATTADATTEIVIDVVRRVVSCEQAGVQEAQFFLDDAAHHRLVNGLDLIDMTLQLDARISDHELRRPDWLPSCDGVVHTSSTVG
ncbi:MAG: 3-isopropylmalate dehydratase small subunit [Pseudonocardiales bacterium]|nr:MAG: 3-isopropylmalate dehydratase small subunit [Pseudonocardiales bacterium]